MQLLRKDKKLTPSWDLVQPSIKLLKDNIWPVFYLSFLPGLIAAVGLVLSGVSETAAGQDVTFGSREAAGLSLALLGGLWSLLAYPGFYYLQSRAIQGRNVEAMEAFKAGLPRLLPLIGMSIVGGLLILIGLLALIVPGLILIRGFFLAPYYVVDQKMGPIEALKASFQDSRPHAGWIWGVIGVEIAFGLAAFAVGLVPVLGTLISMAISYIYIFAPAIRYGEIAKRLKSPVATPTEV